MNHFISLTEAASMTALYRQQKEDILGSAYQNQGILPICETFDRAAFDAVLNQAACTGIRIYYGMDNELKVHAIIAGVNDNDEDILPAQSNSMNETTEDVSIIERGTRCPDICPPESELNTD